MTVATSGARHLLLRLQGPARLPEAMLGVLRDEVVLAGWMRASGVVTDAVVRVGTSAPRQVAGRAQVVTLEGSVGLAAGDVSCGLRVVLAHETESGVETIAGDLVEARIEALEVLVTAFDEVVATRQLDASGVWLLDATSATAPAAAPSAPAAPPPAPAAPAPPAPAAPAPSFAAVVRANETPPAPPAAPPPAPAAPTAPPAPRPSPTFSASAMPARIAKPVVEEEEQAIPEPGDIVDHFAFGRCEVVKTDGDRLHLRLPKDQRIKEIALEMLKVSLLPPEEGETKKHYKLARKL
jgi:predicted DNA-binding protein with PD1-like motif